MDNETKVCDNCNVYAGNCNCENTVIAESTITFNEYQKHAKETALYPKECGIEYTALGLVGEAGEIANKVKKVLRGDYDKAVLREILAGEIGDVLWYTAMLARELDLDLQEIAQGNLDKLTSRKERGVLTGSGDNR